MEAHDAEKSHSPVEPPPRRPRRLGAVGDRRACPRRWRSGGRVSGRRPICWRQHGNSSPDLSPTSGKLRRFPWDGSEWRSWNYFGVGGYIKPGLRLEQMNAAQKAAAWDVLSVLFSPAGIEKTRNVMTLQDVLAASGNGTGQRSSERFSFSVFGTPAETGAWGFRLEGHHLTQSISVRDNRIVAVTPSSFSALPNRITSGKHAGLDHAQGRGGSGAAPRSRSRQQAAREAGSQPLYNILSYAGRERTNGQKVGIAAADMTAGAARPAVAARRHLFGASISRPRSRRRRRRACARATARRCTSPGMARTRPRRRSAIG